MDPLSRCAALALPRDSVAILPFYQSQAELDNVDLENSILRSFITPVQGPMLLIYLDILQRSPLLAKFRPRFSSRGRFKDWQHYRLCLPPRLQQHYHGDIVSEATDLDRVRSNAFTRESDLIYGI